MRSVLKRYAILATVISPFFVFWVFLAMSAGQLGFTQALLSSTISIGTAAIIGRAFWLLCRRWPWPLHPTVGFYALHVLLASIYSILWNGSVCLLNSIDKGHLVFLAYWNSPVLGWQLLTGVWIYGLFVGVAYAVQTRTQLHEKEARALRAESSLNAARLDALRARLNPHFLFNALHTLSALSKFRPSMAEDAIERLGDMLRYSLKEDGRDLVEFSEEFDFTKKYIAFEKLRYEERLQVEFAIDPESFHFQVPPFSLQSLAENAVHHAISIRANGGAIWISSLCDGDSLLVTVKDNGPGNSTDTTGSHNSGLKSLRERLKTAYGADADLHIVANENGFEASFEASSDARNGRESAMGQGI